MSQSRFLNPNQNVVSSDFRSLDVKIQNPRRNRIKEMDLKEEFEFDKNFKRLPRCQVEKLVSMALAEEEAIKERKRMLVLERKYAAKQRELDRRKGRVFLEPECAEEEKTKRDRGRTTKQLEYELSRFQLAMMKLKYKEAKRAAKKKRQMMRVVPPIEYQSGLGYGFDLASSIVARAFEELKGVFSHISMSKLSSIVTFVLVVSRSSDKLLRFSACVNLCLAFDLDLSAIALATIANEFVSLSGIFTFDEELPEEISYQSMTDISSLIDKVLHSDLVGAIRHVFIGITAYLGFPREATATVFSIIGSAPMKMSVLRLIENILSVISKICAASALFWNGRNGKAVPLSEILFGATVMDGFRETYATLGIYKDATYSGLPVPHKMCQFHYMRTAQSFIASVEAHKELIGRHNPSYKILEGWVVDVTSWQNVLADSVAATNRIPAFAVVLPGKPGTGKSLTTKLLASRPAAIKGYRFEESHIYSKPPGEWWEGYRAREHNIVFFSEVAKMAKELAKKMGDDTLDSILSCADSNKFFVPMAFGEKGKVPFLAELIIMDTNNPSLNLALLYENPAAFARRFFYVEQECKEEYCKDGSCEVDYDKTVLLENKFEAFLYTCYYMDAVNAKISQKRVIADKVPWDKMVAIFDREFVRHQMRNSAVNSTVLDFVRSIPSLESPVLSQPPRDSQDLIYDGKDAKNEFIENSIQNRFEFPESNFEEKCERKGVFKGTRPLPTGKTGKEMFEDFKRKYMSYFLGEPVEKELSKLSKAGPVIPISRVPKWLTVEVHFDKTDMRPDYVNRIVVESVAGMDEVKNPSDMFRDWGYANAAQLIDEVLAMLTSPDYKHYESPKRAGELKAMGSYLDYIVADILKTPDDLVRAWKLFKSTLMNLKQFLRIDEESVIYTNTSQQKSVFEFMDRMHGFFHIHYHRTFEENLIGVSTLFQDEKVDEQFGIKEFQCAISSEIESGCEFVLNHLRSLIAYCWSWWWFEIILLYHTLATMHIPYWSAFTGVLLYLIGFGYVALLPLFLILLRWFLRFYFKSYSKNIVERKIRATKGMCLDVINSLGSRFHLCVRKPELQNAWFVLFAEKSLVALIVVGTGVSVYKFVRSILTAPKYQNAFSKIAPVEELVKAAPPRRRVKTQNDPANWNIVAHMHPKYIYTQGLKDFSNMILDRTFFLWFEKTKGVRVVSHGVGICTNVILLNSHFFQQAKDSGCVLWASDTDEEYRQDFTVSLTHFVRGKTDITLATCGRSFKNLVQHMAQTTVAVGEAVIGGFDVVATYDDRGLKVKGDDYPEVYSYTNFSRHGYCGHLLLFSIGKTCMIGGMHIAGGENVGYSIPLNRFYIQSLVEELDTVGSLFRPLSQNQSGIRESTEDVRVNLKSPFAHVHLQSIEYFGTVDRAEANKSSRVELNVFAHSVPSIAAVVGVPIEKVFAPPVMKPFRRSDGTYVSPQNNGLGHFTKPPLMRYEALFDRVVDYLVPKLISRLKEEGKLYSLSPYLMRDAINGSLEDDYFRRINASTAAGFPLSGKKNKFLPVLEGTERIPTDEIMEAVLSIMEDYRIGQRSNSVFKVSLKDEPVSKKKADAGVTRFFYVHPLAHLVVSRMFLGPIVTLIQEADAFCSMVGINMYTRPDRVYEVITKFPFYLEADAEKFDINAAYIPRSASFEIVLRILERLGYNEEALRITRGVLSDLLNPLYILDGDLFSKSSVPSGHYGTAELNCLIILVMLVACFMKGQDDGLIPSGIDFFDHVSPATYGDDQASSVSEVVSVGVNNITLASLYEDLNMRLTASDKASTLTPFVDVKLATFLKRSFEVRGDRIYAPLDPQSIYKMTTLSLESESCSDAERDANIANSALLELCVHFIDTPMGSDKFNAVRQILQDAYMAKYGVLIPKLFTFAYASRLVNPVEYQSGSDDDKNDTGGWPLEVAGRAEDCYCGCICGWCDPSTYPTCECAMHRISRRLHPGSLEMDDEDASDVWLDTEVKLLTTDTYRARKYELLFLIEKEEKELAKVEIPFPKENPSAIKYSNRYASDPKFKQMCDRMLEAYSRLESYRIEYANIDTEIHRVENVLSYQSGVEFSREGPINMASVVHHDTLTEIGGYETKEIDEPVVSRFIKAPATLKEFFSRPIEIGSFAIDVGDNVQNSYDVWDLYTLDPAVRAKLRNMAFFRATINLRISVSGTQFDYGRIMVSPQPWMVKNPAFQALITPPVGSWDKLVLQYMSQAKLSTIVDIKENRPVDISMPWIHPMEVGRLYNRTTTAIATSDSLNDFKGMWTVWIKTLNAMKSVSASPSKIYVYLYAYLSDVEIGIPTASQMAITTQSDERKTGPVETVASNLLRISRALENAPYIGIGARASTFVLQGVRGLASLFGWSAPIIRTVPMRVKNEPFQNGSEIMQCDTGQRLSWDPKQELAISTEYAATMEDELVIAHLAARQSYLTTFTWPAATAPKVNMFNICMHPRMTVGFTSPGSVKNVVPTPMGFASQLFTKWRGKIIITLEVNASSFHKGKLLITYDPNVMQWANIVANINLNKNFIHVWDIQETQRYSICVDWNHPRPWADNLSDADSYDMVGTSLTPLGSWANAVNGFLAISPLTKLQSPDGSDIEVNIYVRAENMEFNRATTNFYPKNREIDYQSAEVSNVDESCIPINEPLLNDKGQASHFYGESILSFRSMFKRFTECNRVTFTPAANKTYTYSSSTYPTNLFRMGHDGSSDTFGVSAFNHVRLAFLTMRGSIRKRLCVLSDVNLLNAPIYVTLKEDESSTNDNSTVDDISDGIVDLMNGFAIYIPSTNAGIEFEIPYYSNNLFSWSATQDPFDFNAGEPQDVYILRGFKAHITAPGTPTYFSVRELFATGEDFQMSCFLGAPPYVSN